MLLTLSFGVRTTLLPVILCNASNTSASEFFPNDNLGIMKNFLPTPFLSHSLTIGNFVILEIPVTLSNSPLLPKVADINIFCFAPANGGCVIVGAIQGLICMPPFWI